jgi:UDP-2,3-diacylglucosamine hydrolase
MATFFISDLHLQASQPDIAEIFLNFLARDVKEADALYILGDLFEAWIGDDDLSSFNQQILQALKQATQNGLPIFFMHGNRDFLIGKKFAQYTGVHLLPDPSVINLYGRRILLMHGDSLCTFDIKHQRLRQIMHNPYYQWLALLTPLSLRRRIGQWWRQQSRRHISENNRYIMDVNQKTVMEVIQEYQVPLLIHGHTHRPAIHPLGDAQRIVLGAWHHQGNALVIDQNNNREFLNF